MREDPRERPDQPRSPIKWILLITVLLLVGVAIQNWFGGGSISDGYAWPEAHGRHGGPQRTATRDRSPDQLTGFDSVTLQGRATLDITVGETASVALEGDPNAVKNMRTAVRGDTLVISRRDGNWFWNNGGGTVTAHITVPRLERLDVRGSSDITIAGSESGSSRITISGAGHLVADGALDSLSLTINGTGKADLTAMRVEAATVVVNGTGQVSLDVRKTLSATVNGAGDIVYASEPEHVNSSVHGVGSVRRG
jgi:Putative auto-transporter adhesin, head GIN domain